MKFEITPSHRSKDSLPRYLLRVRRSEITTSLLTEYKKQGPSRPFLV
jgi:hypothetical protein